MEEKKVRVSYKIYGEKFLSIALEVKEDDALKIFQELYAYGQKKQSSVLEVQEKKGQKKQSHALDVKEKKGKEETIYQKILKFIAENENTTAKEIVEGTGTNKKTVSIYLSKMQMAGEIKHPEGAKTKYCINSGFDQLPVEAKRTSNTKNKVEEKNQEYQKKGEFEKLISNEKYLEIMEYIMKKDSFKMEDIRRILYMYEPLIPDVIRTLSANKLIYYKEENNAYIVPDTTKIWYCLLKENAPVQDIYIYLIN